MESRDKNNAVAKVVYKNIREICDHKRKHELKLSTAEKVAARVSQFAGTTTFVYINAIFFAVWILLNVGLFGMKPFDPFPFVMLTTVVSLEAIFLSLFVLLSQNRMQRVADEQDDGRDDRSEHDPVMLRAVERRPKSLAETATEHMR